MKRFEDTEPKKYTRIGTINPHWVEWMQEKKLRDDKIQAAGAKAFALIDQMEAMKQKKAQDLEDEFQMKKEFLEKHSKDPIERELALRVLGIK